MVHRVNGRNNPLLTCCRTNPWPHWKPCGQVKRCAHALTCLPTCDERTSVRVHYQCWTEILKQTTEMASLRFSSLCLSSHYPAKPTHSIMRCSTQHNLLLWNSQRSFPTAEKRTSAFSMNFCWKDKAKGYFFPSKFYFENFIPKVKLGQRGTRK